MQNLLLLTNYNMGSASREPKSYSKIKVKRILKSNLGRRRQMCLHMSRRNFYSKDTSGTGVGGAAGDVWGVAVSSLADVLASSSSEMDILLRLESSSCGLWTCAKTLLSKALILNKVEALVSHLISNLRSLITQM